MIWFYILIVAATCQALLDYYVGVKVIYCCILTKCTFSLYDTLSEAYSESCQTSKGPFKLLPDKPLTKWWIVFWYGWPTEGVYLYFQPGPLSEILTISNLQHATSRIWTCAEPEFRLCWMKLCSSDNHYTTAPQTLLNICSMSICLLRNTSCPTSTSEQMNEKAWLNWWHHLDVRCYVHFQVQKFSFGKILHIWLERRWWLF